jgi:hypothetical protein
MHAYWCCICVHIDVQYARARTWRQDSTRTRELAAKTDETGGKKRNWQQRKETGGKEKKLAAKKRNWRQEKKLAAKKRRKETGGKKRNWRQEKKKRNWRQEKKLAPKQSRIIAPEKSKITCPFFLSGNDIYVYMLCAHLRSEHESPLIIEPATWKAMRQEASGVKLRAVYCVKNDDRLSTSMCVTNKIHNEHVYVQRH